MEKRTKYSELFFKNQNSSLDSLWLREERKRGKKLRGIVLNKEIRCSNRSCFQGSHPTNNKVTDSQLTHTKFRKKEDFVVISKNLQSTHKLLHEIKGREGKRERKFVKEGEKGERTKER